MSLAASLFIGPDSRVAHELQDHTDQTQVRYTQPMLLGYLNESQRVIVSLRPDITATPESVQLTPGTRQSIPSGRMRLIEVIRNMGSNGTTPGRPITPVKRGDLDLYRLTWHTETAATVIKSYTFDERFPKIFYVTPPVHATTPVYAEIITSAAPTECTADGDISLDDIYETAIKDFMLWMAFSIDIDSLANQGRAAQHLQHAYQVLGIKMQADTWVNPRGARNPSAPAGI